jgi:hypothetical protein
MGIQDNLRDSRIEASATCLATNLTSFSGEDSGPLIWALLQHMPEGNTKGLPRPMPRSSVGFGVLAESDRSAVGKGSGALQCL